MDVKNCRSCRRLFNYIGGQQICPACKDKLEKKFYSVKEFIRENPHMGMKEISDACDVSQQQLRTWVREERLEFSSDSDVAMECERCGKKIFTGRFCDECKGKMAQGLTDAFEGKKVEEPRRKKKTSKNNAMRFIKK